MKSAFFIRFTETNVSEIVATSEEPRRNHLLNSVQALMSDAHCVYPYQWIIDQQAAMFDKSPLRFDWKKLNIRFRGCEDEIARRNIISSALATEQRQQVRLAESQFNGIYQRVAPILQRQFGNGSRPTLQEYVQSLKRGEGPIWGIGRGLFERAVTHQSSDAAMQEFYAKCPPFRALLLALCIAEYERCIRDEKEGESYRAGRFDLLMATYLPYCDQFITDDERQLRCLLVVATESNLNVAVRSYTDFRTGLIGPR